MPYIQHPTSVLQVELPVNQLESVLRQLLAFIEATKKSSYTQIATLRALGYALLGNASKCVKARSLIAMP